MEHAGQLPVVRPDLEAGVDVLGELDHVPTRLGAGVLLGSLVQQLQRLDLLSRGHPAQILVEGCRLLRRQYRLDRHVKNFAFR